ncbi:MAG: hypothetical protein AMXMBFR61_05440 [Fimbriimonadales bacterium]
MDALPRDPTGGTEWLVVAASVTGSAHERAGTRCQDRVMWKADPTAVAVALADGHGSARSPLSHVGAQMAVEVATERLFDLRQCSREQAEQEASERLPRQLVGGWREKVDADRSSEDREPIQYGTTLLAILATSEYVLALQLGDGDILRVRSDGGVERIIQRDPALIANETTSLCGENAAQDVRTAVIPVGDTALILAATDGYANAFQSDADFLATGPDYLDRVRARTDTPRASLWGQLISPVRRVVERFPGLGRVASGLPGWSRTASEHGSGDDITVALLVRSAALEEELSVNAEAVASEAAVDRITQGPSEDG